MRYSGTHKEETRKRVVEAASRQIRARGPGGVSVAEVMAEVGLTHGGFYAHFPSKDALLGAAITQAFDDRLHERTDRHDEHPDGTRGAVLDRRVREPAQDGQTARDRVAARREPLVGQGLPRGEIDDRRRGQVALQRAGERLGLAAGRGDREECARAGIRRQEAGDQRRAKAFDQREIGASGALREGTLERAGARKPRDQSVQSHRTSLRGAGDVAAEARSNVTLDAAARATA